MYQCMDFKKCDWIASDFALDGLACHPEDLYTEKSLRKRIGFAFVVYLVPANIAKVPMLS